MTITGFAKRFRRISITGVIKAVDRLAGPLLHLLPPPGNLKPSHRLESVLIIRPGGIGDAALLAPAINQLKRDHPGVKISILAEKRNGGIFNLIPAVDDLFLYDSPARFFSCLSRRYDAVIDTEQWHHLSALVARYVDAPVKCGFDTNRRRRMFTHLALYSHDDYEIESFFRLFAPLYKGEVEGSSVPFLTPPAAAVQMAERMLSPLDGRPFVVIFPGASVAERRWGADRYRVVAEGVKAGGYGVVVVGGGQDRYEGEVITKGLGVDLTGRCTLAQTSAVIARSALFISGDSGLLHIAVGLDTPTVSLFGPGRALKWAPGGGRHLVINLGVKCSPCTTFGNTPPCPNGTICMSGISPQMVLESALQQLSDPGQTN